jgi:prefoldin subunit 5
MTVLWDKIKKSVIDTLNEAIDKTEELTSVGRIKLEILQLEHRLDEHYAELGKFVYQNLSEQPGILVLEGKISELKKAIDELKEQLRQKERELGRIREEDGVDFDS